MANQFFDNFKEKLLAGDDTFDLDDGSPIKAALYSNTDYTPAYTTHTQFTDSGFTRYSGTTDQTLTTTITDGVFDDSTGTSTFANVTLDTGKTVDGVLIYQDGGTDATRLLICTLDSFTSVTPNGGNIDVNWNGSGIFAL